MERISLNSDNYGGTAGVVLGYNSTVCSQSRYTPTSCPRPVEDTILILFVEIWEDNAAQRPLVGMPWQELIEQQELQLLSQSAPAQLH